MKKINSPSSFLKFVKKNISSKDFRSQEGEDKINGFRNKYMTFFDEAIEPKKKREIHLLFYFKDMYLSSRKKEEIRKEFVRKMLPLSGKVCRRKR